MAGISVQSCVPGLEQIVKTQDENAFKLRHINIVAPELIQEIEGKLEKKQDELAVCLTAHRPYYPLWTSDLVEFFYQPRPGNLFSGSAKFFDEPAMINGIYIFKVVNFISSDIKMAKEVVDSFKHSEMHKLGIDSESAQAIIPQGYELCYYLIILNRGQPSITIASVAMPQFPQA